MDNENIQKILFVSASEQYGDKYIEHLLEQYKIYISSAEKISDRRQKTNEFFLALNTGLVALLGFVTTKALQGESSVMIVVSALAGTTMCFLWYRILLSYKGLNSGKFEVIHAIERRLPLALYDTEWEALGRGKDKSKYWPFTHIEASVPWIFICIYIILIFSVVPWSVLKALIPCF